MNKKILFSLIFVLLVSFLVIPNAYAGDNDPIVFTGTKFLTYLLQGNFGNYAWLDANKDGKLSQNELNELTGQMYINSNGWDSEDFENLKYLKNVSQIILTEAHNTVEEVDLSGLTNLRYFSVEKANADYPPKFKLNNNLWQYLSPECEYVYNSELDISEKTYNYENTENFKIYTLYLGGASTIHVDEVVHLADTQITIYNDAIIDVTRSNVAIVDHSVIEWLNPEDGYRYTEYGLKGLKTGTTTVNFSNDLNERSKTITVVKNNVNVSPDLETGNVGLKLLYGGKVLAANGELYEINSSNSKGQMTKIDSGVKDYCNDGDSIAKLKGTNLIFDYYYYDSNDNYHKASTTIPNVKQYVDGRVVLKTDNTLVYLNVDNKGNITQDVIMTNVSQLVQQYFVANSKVYFISYDYFNGKRTAVEISGITATSITDYYIDFLQVGNKLYYMEIIWNEELGRDEAKGYLLTSNFDSFRKTKSGRITGYKLKNGEYTSEAHDWYATGYEGPIHMEFDEETVRGPYINYNFDFYVARQNGDLRYGRGDALQLVKVEDVNASGYYDYETETYEVYGILALRSDNTVWIQEKPFDNWVKILSIKDGLNGLNQVDGVWAYYNHGSIDTSFTDITYYKGTWFYIENGYLKWDANTLVNHDGNWFYIKNGMVDWSYTGLANYKNTWFYVKAGMVDWSYTGLCQYNGTWFYIKGGMINWTEETLVNYNNTWFKVKGGLVDWGYTGLFNYNGTWFYIQGGTINWSAKTLVNYNGNWFYVQGGSVAWGFTGIVDYGGSKFYIQGGMINWGYTGQVTYNGQKYNVKGGIVV